MVDRKTYVIDTSVFLHDPNALLTFESHDIVIPIAVLEELDAMKSFQDELAKNANHVIRFFEFLKEIGKGDFHKGITLPKGATVRIQLEKEHLVSPPVKGNYRILMTAYLLFEKGKNVVFVSKDLTMRIKAEAMGLLTEGYENKKISYDSLYRGIRHIKAEKTQIDLFKKDEEVVLSKEEEFFPNEYCHLSSVENTFALGKYDQEKKKLTALLKKPSKIWGISPKNVEQNCALDILLRDEVKLVTLVGPAGTGKTLLALAAGMDKVFDEGKYNRILVSRPIVPLGRDIGYLPGFKEEKLIHWMQPIYDNLEYLCDCSGKEANETLKWVLESKKLEMEAMTYIRGRSLPKIYMIIDEAQNLTPHEVKTIISRAGTDTKVVLTGDPTQIDHPYLDKDSNGLTHIVGCFKQRGIFGHVFMEKTERSPLAALAAEVM